MFPFAAVLAIAAMGQTLVIQQGGIDLSVPGMMSLTIVLLTSYPVLQSCSANTTSSPPWPLAAPRIS
jgi:ribose/xylose/arabinose/galactoside ABC-type transport system permease subunit